MKRLHYDGGSEVTKCSVKKCGKSGSAIGEDCISNLPESIISRILSSLPTEDAVRTCVLSKDWEFKWTSIYHVEIDDHSSEEHNKVSFVNYVDRILLLSHDIRSFHLQLCAEYDSSHVIGWISTVLRRNVEDFELCYTTAQGGLFLPDSVLKNTSLKRLSLDFPDLPCTFKLPSHNHFPNLLYMQLGGVEIRNELSNIDTLTFTFPVLETMELIQCEWLKVKLVEINAPALTTFMSWSAYGAQVDDYSININGGRLTDFNCSGGLPENLTLTGTSVVNVIINNTEDSWSFHLLESGLLVRKLLNGFQNLEDMMLSGWITKAIGQSREGLALPRYNKLQRLSLDGCIDIEVLLELLHAAPYLRSLVFELLSVSTSNGYEAVGSLPYCLLNHLDEVEFFYYVQSVHDFHLEKFMLKNGLRLKAFHLRCGYQKDRIPKILENLLAFPKGSNCVTFVIR